MIKHHLLIITSKNHFKKSAFMVHGAKQLLFLPLPKALADSGPWAASLLSFGQVSMGFKVDVVEALGNTMSWGTYVSMTTLMCWD